MRRVGPFERNNRSVFTLVSLAVIGSLPLLAGCPKKPVPVAADAEVAAVDAAPAVVEPIVEDAGGDAADAAEAGKTVHHGPAVNPTVAHLRQCCAALATQGAALGTSPEAAMIKNASITCNSFAAQVGPGGNAPELAPFRAMLKAGKGVPAICSSL